MSNKLLLIIDPQIDFISGTLPVPGARDAMDLLADYVRKHGAEYSQIIVTADRHPMRHCSFKEEGGAWPRHCIADSMGAAIWPALMNELLEYSDKVEILHKGEQADREEYSIMKNAKAANEISRIIDSAGIRHIDICGLAGDVCVADTIRDWMAKPEATPLCILSPFTPSIDGGETLRALTSDLGLQIERK